MDLDHGLAEQPPRDWSRMFAAWSPDGLAAAIDQLNEHLVREVMEPIGPIGLRLSDTHADYFADSRPVCLAEVRVLPLRMPNPMPRVRLFCRSRRRA